MITANEAKKKLKENRRRIEDTKRTQETKKLKEFKATRKKLRVDVLPRVLERVNAQIERVIKEGGDFIWFKFEPSDCGEYLLSDVLSELMKHGYHATDESLQHEDIFGNTESWTYIISISLKEDKEDNEI